jgi:hypothetical protein
MADRAKIKDSAHWAKDILSHCLLFYTLNKKYGTSGNTL